MSSESTPTRAGRDAPASASGATEISALVSNVEAPSSAEGRANDEVSIPATTFADLPLSDFLVLFMRSPASTMRRLRVAIKSDQARQRLVPKTERPAPINMSTRTEGDASRAVLRQAPGLLLNSEFQKLALYLLAFVLALVGSTYARGTADISRYDGNHLQVAAPYLWLGFLLWLLGDIRGDWSQIRDYWRRCDVRTRLLWSARVLPGVVLCGSLLVLAQSMSAPRDSAVDKAQLALVLAVCGLLAYQLINFWFRRAQPRPGAFAGGRSLKSETTLTEDRIPAPAHVRREISRWRISLAMLASLLSLVVWANTGGNRIEPRIIMVWLASIVAWAFVFAPLRWNIFDWSACAIDRARRLDFKGRRWAILALALVLLVGASFRFNQLDSAPPEMISDMVVNIVDAYRIHRGEHYPIFLGNNGGREPIHIYLQAFMSGLPGLQFDRTTLVLVTALESFLTLPVMYWFAVEVIGKQRRQHALTVGILATALLAVSFWHVSLSRQGLRIPLSPLFAALSAVFFVRALRHNRRADFILAGIMLSFGLYSYKSLRMLPVVYVISLAVALLIRRYTWRMRASYVLNLVVLALVAGAVFLPMLHYWFEEPGQFTWRATTRIFGDQPTTDAERLALLREGGATFLSNVRNALLMFHHTHDNTWVSAIPGQPALDPATGAFLVLGAAAWLVLMARERDPVYWFVPILFFVMILLTALAIAFPIEVPSLQRASGAIPPTYLIAALPLALICRQLYKTLPRVLGSVAAVCFAVAVIVAAYQYNHDLYFGDFMENYHRSAQNHSEAGQVLRGFAESDGAYGNAFIISSPHWWDHRAVGVEAGAMRWDNSIVEVRRLPHYLRNGMRRRDEYQLQAERDLLFFFAPRNEQAPPLLRQWFPTGRQVEFRQEPLDKTFFAYRVPALGEDGLQEFLAGNS